MLLLLPKSKIIKDDYIVVMSLMTKGKKLKMNVDVTNQLDRLISRNKGSIQGTQELQTCFH